MTLRQVYQALKTGRGVPECLDVLPPREADAVHLLVRYEKRVSDVAEIFRVTPREVKTAYIAGLRKIGRWYEGSS